MMDNFYVLEEEFPVYCLDCNQSFKNLNHQEKLYSSSLIKAGWCGALIDLIQCSPESPGIFLLSQKLFKRQNPNEIDKLIKSLNYSESDSKNFLNYFAMFYDNLGNYRSFGDSKFIPRIEEDKFNKIITNSDAYKTDNIFREIFNRIKNYIYNLTPRNKQLGLGDQGISTYYSSNCNLDDAELIQPYLDNNNISAYNTRVFKKEGEDFVDYEVRQASILINDDRELKVENQGKKVKVKLVSGDYRELMGLMCQHLDRAKQVALNETQQKMIQCYIESFQTGSIDCHKDGSRHWIQDKGPAVEHYIGFIESYRDPFGVRGEFEAFIAVVNKEMSAKFATLVEKAESLLNELPWPKQYEKDMFLKPDFTSLDIINFPNSGMPVGINIPNYDDIRQNEGFKNVSLGNVLKARFKDPKSNFIAIEDKELFVKHIAEAFEIQVGLHELIGHGSGKLFKMSNGKPNYDVKETKDIIGGGDITNWYKENETWDSVFTTVASPFEECRAECVGLYLCGLPVVLKIFGHKDAAIASDIVYINWLSMIKSSVVSMEFYTPEQHQWRQAHCHARFVILRVLMEAGQDFVAVDKVVDDDGKDNIVIRLDRTKIDTVGRPAIGHFLKCLQYYKSTANVNSGREFFNRYSFLNDQFLELRDIVLRRKLPRGIVIQSLIRDDGVSEPDIIEYPATTHGMIQSFVDRFSDIYGELAETALLADWNRDEAHFF